MKRSLPEYERGLVPLAASAPTVEAAASRVESKTSLHMPSLDGLRTISFLLVFLAHGGLPWFFFPVPGGFGVTIFFFLSGFLITTLMRVEKAKTGTVSLVKFYLRRALRILPPFYLVLLGAVVASLVGLLPGGLNPRGVLAQACHYANYWIIQNTYVGIPLGTGVYWSLAVEEHFYLLFPALFLLFARVDARPGRQVAVLLGLSLLVLAWRAYLVGVIGVSVWRTELATDTRLDSLLFGCALAVYENPALDRSAFADRTWKYGLFPLGLAGLLVSFLVRDEFFREVFRYSLQGLCLMPLFVCAIRYPDWLPMRFLNLRPIAKLGTLSYSLYLMHQVVLAVVEEKFQYFSAWPRAALSLALSILLAWLMYRGVEKPCANLRRTLSA